MVTILEKIKDIFNGQVVYKPKYCAKKEEPKVKEEGQKEEEKLEERREQPST